MTLTFISDTHGKHDQVTSLNGGDILIHAGDISNVGHLHQVRDFLEWFSNLPYKHKIFIAGNHDFCFETYLRENDVQDLLNEFKDEVTYLQDSEAIVSGLKIYGSPWQPRFHDWAFNLGRNSDELNEKWKMIPDDTDILITHGPAYGYVDTVLGRTEHLGCELLRDHIVNRIKPRVHVCGHIHSGNGLYSNDVTFFVNASVLDERYNYTYEPRVIEITN